MQLEQFFTDIEKIVRLYKEGKSSPQVAKETGYPRQYVSETIRLLGLTREHGWHWRGNKNPNWNPPNLKMTPALAYISGVLYGDGSIDKRGHVRLTVTKRKFVESFAKAIRGIGLRPHKMQIFTRFSEGKGLPNFTPHETTFYQTGFISKLFKNWFTSIHLDVIELLLDKPELMREFIRGFYESEGTYSPPPNIRIEMVNSNRELILLCKRLLEKLGYRGTHLIERKRKPPRKIQYRLYIRRIIEVNRFLAEIKPKIKAK